MSFYDLIHLADSSFVRAEPARKSGSGFIKMLKKSFGKGKHKRNRKLSEMTSSPRGVIPEVETPVVAMVTLRRIRSNTD